jgi:hypothetical protein
MSQIITYQKKTIAAVECMLNIDKYDINRGKRIEQILQILMDSKEFVTMISNGVKTVMADKKINAADFPTLMLMGLQTNSFLEKIQLDSADLKAEEACLDSVKYIVFGAIYFGLCMAKADETTLSMITMFYPGLWSLIKINPNTIKNAAKSLFK